MWDHSQTAKEQSCARTVTNGNMPNVKTSLYVSTNLQNNLDPWYCSACSSPCGVCDQNVRELDTAILCDSCEWWFHTACTGVSESAYQQLQTSGDIWNCLNCELSTFSDSFFENYDELENEGASTGNITCTSGERDKGFLPAGVNRQTHNKSKLRCLLINCQSIRGKVADLQALIQVYQPDIICGTKSWLNSTIESSEIFPSNYKVFWIETQILQEGVFSRQSFLTWCQKNALTWTPIVRLYGRRQKMPSPKQSWLELFIDRQMINMV